VLPLGLPKMRKNASQHGCWGLFCAPAAGICSINITVEQIPSYRRRRKKAAG